MAKLSKKTPESRKGHTFAKVNDHLVLFGGEGPNPKADLSAIYLCNLETYTWYKVDGGTEGLSSRSGMAFEHIDKSTLVLFGGVENATGKFLDDFLVWDLEKMEITKHEAHGDYPEARTGHMMCKTRSKDFSKLLVLGGINSIIVSMDIYFIAFDKKNKIDNLPPKGRKTDEDREVERIANDYLFEMNKKNNEIRDLILFETQKQLKFKRQYDEAEKAYKSAADLHNEKVSKKQLELDNLKKQKEQRLSNIDSFLEQIKMEEVRNDLRMEKIMLLQQTFRDIFKYTSNLDKVLTIAATTKSSDKIAKDTTVVDLIKENRVGLKGAKDKLLDYLSQTKQFYLDFETNHVTIDKAIETHKEKIIRKFPVFEKMYKDNELNLSVIESSENED